MTAPAPCLDDIEIAAMEGEFAKPCHAKPNTGACPNEAKWAVWFKHGGPSCPMDIYLCTEHKDMVIEAWEHIIKDHPQAYCQRCGKSSIFHGKQLSDLVRVVEL